MSGGDHLSRRQLVAGAVTSAGGMMLGCTTTGADTAATLRSDLSFRTPLCDVLGIEYPVLQAPMSRIVTPEMVAAVSNTGGLGIYPGIGVSPQELRSAIEAVRQLTDRPFGVNLILHEDLVEPANPASVAASTLSAVQRTLNGIRREVGIAESTAGPPGFPDVIGPALEILLEERVPVFSIGLGLPSRELVDRFHNEGITVIAMAATVEDCIQLSASGVDAVVAQGSDAGGHRSTWSKRPSADYASIGTFSLVPQVAEAIPQPVVAAGGITNGRGLIASIALGAAGVLMGTRFIATAESAAPEFYKSALVDSSSDDTVVTDAFTGLYARVLRNRYTQIYGESSPMVLPAGMQQIAIADIVSESATRGTGDYYPMYAGQGLGLIQDVPTSADVINAVMEEARRELQGIVERMTS
jgi:nitronate monooxygenase